MHNFNPRPPRGGRLPSASDTQTDGTFQSTPPARGATISKADYSKKYAISIHAPREGGDKAGKLAGRMNRNFNPRPPRGGRPAMRLLAKYLDTFQSTPPARGATPPVPPPLPAALDFNPRPPRGGRRPDGFTGFRINRNFNPRPPRGGRRYDMIDATSINIISIHAPREGGDNFQIMAFNMFHVFQSTPPARGATARQRSLPAGHGFQSTPPARGATAFQISSHK